jgi:hypothetical protein
MCAGQRGEAIAGYPRKQLGVEIADLRVSSSDLVQGTTNWCHRPARKHYTSRRLDDLAKSFSRVEQDVLEEHVLASSSFLDRDRHPSIVSRISQ